MSTTYLGALSLGEFYAGVKVVIDPLHGALLELKAQAQIVISAALTLKASIQAAIDLAASLMLSAHGKIRLLALADLQVQLDAAIALTASLSVSLTDPALYLNGLIAGSLQVQANLGLLLPTVALNAQLSAALSLQASLTLKIKAFDLALDLVLSISAQLAASIKAELDAFFSVTAQLEAAIALCLQPLALVLDLQAKFALAAAPTYRFDGQLQDLGNEIDTLITGGTTGGLGLTDGVRAWVIVVPTAAVPLLDAANSLLP